MTAEDGKPMAKKTRSPLHGAPLRDIAALRALVEANLRWERALDTPQQTLHPNEPVWALLRLSYSTRDRIQTRSRGRWEQSEHYQRSFPVWEDRHLRRYNREAWEKKHLRAEVAELRNEVKALREDLDPQRPSVH